jgi:hypothetical protein
LEDGPPPRWATSPPVPVTNFRPAAPAAFPADCGPSTFSAAPAWYSYARLLRERYGYKKELRAVGNVLRDQFLFMHRCGIDAYAVTDEKAAADWTRALKEISVVYQPATDRRRPIPTLRHRAPAGRTRPSGSTSDDIVSSWAY